MWSWYGSGDNVDLSQWLDVQDEVCRPWALPSFLDANYVEYVAINVYIDQDEKRHIKDYQFALSVIKKAATTIP